MLDGFGGLNVARNARAPIEAQAGTDAAVPRDGPQDRAAAAVRRPSDTPQPAVVMLSRQAEVAMSQRPGPPAPDDPRHNMPQDEDLPPPAPRRWRAPANVSVALARYRQVAYDPASTFISEESPFCAQHTPDPPPPIDDG